jgi:hypothetical protein
LGRPRKVIVKIRLGRFISCLVVSAVAGTALPQVAYAAPASGDDDGKGVVDTVKGWFSNDDDSERELAGSGSSRSSAPRRPGAEHVTRADPADLAGWRIPEPQKALLVNVGAPVVHQLIEYVAFQTDPDPALETTSETVLYQLPRNHHGRLVPGLEWTFGVEPDTGRGSLVCQLLHRSLAADTAPLRPTR